MTEPAPLTVSVSVPTRNRPAHLVECVRSILAAGGFIDLTVVDQSDDFATRDALAGISDDRLRYLRTETRGVTRGRNLGIELSAGDIIAFTDDDCRVRADWVPRIVQAFVRDPLVAVVCGRVVVPAQIRHLGYAEAFEPRVREWYGRYPPYGADWGLTANFSIRRSALPRIGLFDPILGAGAPLRSGGEPDFLFRALRAGFKVLNAEEVVVDHLGIRKPGAESTRLMRGYGFGIAAAFMKHVRLGDLAAAAIYLRFVASTAGRVLANTVKHGRPIGAGFLLALLVGGFGSFKYGIDGKLGMYVER